MGLPIAVSNLPEPRVSGRAATEAPYPRPCRRLAAGATVIARTANPWGVRISCGSSERVCFWTEPCLRPTERDCLRSIFAQAHKLTPFCYAKPAGVPMERRSRMRRQYCPQLRWSPIPTVPFHSFRTRFVTNSSADAWGLGWNAASIFFAVCVPHRVAWSAVRLWTRQIRLSFTSRRTASYLRPAGRRSCHGVPRSFDPRLAEAVMRRPVAPSRPLPLGSAVKS